VNEGSGQRDGAKTILCWIDANWLSAEQYNSDMMLINGKAQRRCTAVERCRVRHHYNRGLETGSRLEALWQDFLNENAP